MSIRMSIRLVAILVLSLFSASADASILWKGDFDTGNRSQWNAYFSPQADGVTVVTDHPANGSKYAAKIVLNPNETAVKRNISTGASLGGSMAHRSELSIEGRKFKEGDEVWMKWQAYFPASWSVTDGKHGGAVFTQWHHVSASGTDYSGSPPLLFVATSKEMWITYCAALGCPSPTNIYVAPLLKDHWYTLVAHLKWSSDKTKGLLEFWVDGKQAYSKNIATLFPGYVNYLQAGQYDRPTVAEKNTSYLDGFVLATTKEDVFGASPAPVPTPTPSPNPVPAPTGAPTTTPGPTDGVSGTPPVQPDGGVTQPPGNLGDGGTGVPNQNPGGLQDGGDTTNGTGGVVPGGVDAGGDHGVPPGPIVTPPTPTPEESSALIPILASLAAAVALLIAWLKLRAR